MDAKANLNILLIMVFVGGFFISVAVYVFIALGKFLERERIAGEKFRADYADRKARIAEKEGQDK